jgi:hypothetical protein
LPAVVVVAGACLRVAAAVEADLLVAEVERDGLRIAADEAVAIGPGLMTPARPFTSVSDRPEDAAYSGPLDHDTGANADPI